uniref:Uncharacterized protein n=1 Tax=viral metagenome TaxID=1070528 RepID=A0A6H1ZA56_9ZZZZ
MPYRVTDIRMVLEASKISIATSLQEYLHHDAIPPDPEIPDDPGTPAWDEVLNARNVSSASKVDPFNSASLNAAKVILVDEMEKQLKFHKRLMDKERDIVDSGVLITLKNNIQAKLDALP